MYYVYTIDIQHARCVSTTADPEPTTRLAMSIDGATQMGDVNTTAWEASRRKPATALNPATKAIFETIYARGTP
jgi:hypothetical protein